MHQQASPNQGEGGMHDSNQQNRATITDMNSNQHTRSVMF